MRGNEIFAARLLIGMGLVGQMLARGEQPLPAIRTVLTHNRFTGNEISIIFSTLRNEGVRGLKVNIRTLDDIPYWSLEGVVFQG